jgi:cell shape-determining protein MreC
MKKSHLDNNKKIKFLIYFFCIFIFLSVTISFLYKSKVADLYVYIYDSVFTDKDRVKMLESENGNLKNEIQSLKNIMLEKNILDTEINAGIVDNIKAEKVNLSLLGKDFLYSDILLNKGSIDGVEVGAIVYLPGLKFVGKILEVSEKTSKLKLYSANNFENEFILKQETESVELATTTDLGDNFTFTGIGDGSYGIKIKIPTNLIAKVGGIVYAKEDTINPTGEIAYVQEIISKKEKEVHIKTYYNPAKYTNFYITR